MKKLFTFVIAMLLLASSAYAEIGATAYTNNPQVGEEAVYAIFYNNSGTDISSNFVVILDTTAANSSSGSTLGCRITTTTTSGDWRFIGVTDEVIENGTSGRVCVKGPHKCYLANIAGLSAGASLIVTTTTGALGMPGFQAASPAVVAIALSSTAANGSWSATTGTQLQSDGFVVGEGTSNYWIYLKTAGSGS